MGIVQHHGKLVGGEPVRTAYHEIAHIKSQVLGVAPLNHVLETDDVETQWGQMMRRVGVEVVHALSPQAKGKVERPYRWLQDRIERLEDKADRDQVLLMSETKMMAELINQQAQKPSIVQQTLEFFGFSDNKEKQS